MIAGEYGYARRRGRRHLIIPGYPLGLCTPIGIAAFALCGTDLTSRADVEPDERPYQDECLRCQRIEARIEFNEEAGRPRYRLLGSP